MLLKKYAMLAVKGFVSLFPKPIREFAKRNPKLTALYSRALHRSGLFYGLPNKKKLFALYKGMLVAQHENIVKLQRQNSPPQHKLDVLVVGFKRADINKTVQSLREYANFVGQIFIQERQTPFKFETGRSLEAVKTVKNWGELAHQSTHSVLLLNAGDILYTSSLGILLTQLNNAHILYCDTDISDENGQRHSPHLLPDWNPELQISTAYVNTGVLVGRSIMNDKSLFSAKHLPSCMCISPFLLSIAEQDYFKKHYAVRHIPLSLVQRKKRPDYDRIFVDAKARYFKQRYH